MCCGFRKYSLRYYGVLCKCIHGLLRLVSFDGWFLLGYLSVSEPFYHLRNVVVSKIISVQLRAVNFRELIKIHTFEFDCVT